MSDIKVNIYARRARLLRELIGESPSPDAAIGAVYPRLEMGRERWLVPAYLRLLARGLKVSLADRFDATAVNVVHNDDLEFCDAPWRYFLASVRADRDPAFISHVDICQNNSSVWNSRDVFIQYWPQPGLVPRDPGRGNSLKTVAYFGKADNLAQPFKDPSFSRQLAERGIQFRIEERQWHDYSAVDLVLSIRSGAREYLCGKPASKLVNAWLAGCPAILNAEHGYLELRRSAADFLIAETADAAIRQIAHLATHPDVFQAMVLNGQRRARDFSAEGIASIWHTTLTGSIGAAFSDWKRWSEARRRAWHAVGRAQRLGWGWQVIQQPPGMAKSALRFVRRAVVLPRAATLPVRPYAG